MCPGTTTLSSLVSILIITRHLVYSLHSLFLSHMLKSIRIRLPDFISGSLIKTSFEILERSTMNHQETVVVGKVLQVWQTHLSVLFCKCEGRKKSILCVLQMQMPCIEISVRYWLWSKAHASKTGEHVNLKMHDLVSFKYCLTCSQPPCVISPPKKLVSWLLLCLQLNTHLLWLPLGT